MYIKDRLSKSSLVVTLLVTIAAVGGYFLYRQATGYGWLSNAHFRDVIGLKLWTIFWLCASVLTIYRLRRWSGSHLLAVYAVSVYFIVLFGLQFRGTEFGWNAYWGDNSVIIAATCKMMHYGSWLQDWYLRGLPSFYPPGWFALMAVYGKLLNIEAYQTIKFGYLFLFLIYPWTLYWLWQKLVSKAVSAAVVVCTLFFAYTLLEIGWYEHLSAGLFLPWWLYYFEGATAHDRVNPESDRQRLLVGSIIGGCLFMTYYYWFFLAIAALPFSMLVRKAEFGSWNPAVIDLRRKIIVLAGVALVSSPYWIPLLMSLFTFGMESTQGIWFQIGHADFTSAWEGVSISSLMIVGGIIAFFSLWERWRGAKILTFFVGALVVIAIDRLTNFWGFSFQSRKIFDYIHVFTAAPLAIAVMDIWDSTAIKRHFRLALIGVGLVCALVIGNQQSELYEDNAYKIGINSRKPLRFLEPFTIANTHGTVFLTDKYEASCYFPFYLFIPTGSAGVHPAGRYSERVQFLQVASKIDDPDLFAYAMAYNHFDSVSYIFLPVNKDTKRTELTLYQIHFNAPTSTVTLEFLVDFSQRSDLYELKHSDGLYEIRPAARNAETDNIMLGKYPDVAEYLKEFEK